MAPRTTAFGRSSQVQSVLDLALHLQHVLTNSPDNPALAFPDLSLYVKGLPFTPNEVSREDRMKLNKHGVMLWNLCSKLNRQTGQEDCQQDLARLRAFAYLLLQSAAGTGRRHLGGALELLRNALKASRDCIGRCSRTEGELSADYEPEAKALEFASSILESAAAQLEALGNNSSNSGNAFNIVSDSEKLATVSAEYMLLRLVLAWRQGRLDLADHFYAKTKIRDVLKDPSGLEKLADILYEIGTDEAEKKHQETASIWLKRATCLLEEHPHASLNPDMEDMVLNVLHSYVRVLLALEQPEAGSEARQVLERLRKDHGDKLSVRLLKLEVFSRDPSPCAEAFFSELKAISRSVHMIESNYNLVMHYIHRLRFINETSAWKALLQLIVERLTPDGLRDWTERAVVTLIWMSTSPLLPANQPRPEVLVNWLNDICLTKDESLSSEATHGALVLIWKKVEDAAARQDHESTLGWCTLALHKMFEKAGEQNIGKIQRKTVTAYIGAGDQQAAAEILSVMSSATQTHCLSRFLSYSLAVRKSDEADAQRLLSSIAAFPDEENRLLLACVSETMHHGTKRQGTILLQRILDKYNYDPPSEVNTCVLLRCTTRLLLSVLEEEPGIDTEMLSYMCRIFKAVARFSSKCNSKASSTNAQCPRTECEWFSKTGYNTSLRHIGDWPKRCVIDLLQYTSEIQYPSDCMNDEIQSLDLHRSNILYIQTVLYIVEARKATSQWSTDDIPQTSYDVGSRPEHTEIRQTLYRNALKRSTSSIQVVSEIMRSQAGLKLEEHFKRKQISILPLSFEAALHLIGRHARAEELSLLQIVDLANHNAAPVRTFALLADMVLSAATQAWVDDSEELGHPQPPLLPIHTAVTLLQKLINAVRSFEGYNLTQASRWIRCIVQFVFDSGGLAQGENVENLKLLDEITGQALVLANAALMGQGDVQMTNGSDQDNFQEPIYPRDELEWLCTMLFNLAVDLYVAEQGEEGKKWAERACEIADVLGMNRISGDSGVLAKVLRERMGRLGWL